MRSPEQIRIDVYGLRDRLKLRYGMTADLQLIDMSLSSKLISKQLEEIDSVFANYTASELAEAHDLNMEADALAAMADGEPAN